MTHRALHRRVVLAPIVFAAACTNEVSITSEMPKVSATETQPRPTSHPPLAERAEAAEAMFRAVGLRNTQTGGEILAYLNASLLRPEMGAEQEMAKTMTLLERHPAEVVATLEHAYTNLPETNYPARSKLVFVMGRMKDAEAISALETIARSDVPTEKYHPAPGAHWEGGSRQEELRIRSAAGEAIARMARVDDVALRSLRTLLGSELHPSIQRTAIHGYSRAGSMLDVRGPAAPPATGPIESDEITSAASLPDAPVVCDEPRYATYDDLVLVGPGGWNCEQSRINDWWAAFGYSQSNWDGDNWGYYAPCDPQYPLAGAFNANFLLEAAPWYASYAREHIDKLDGETCSTDNLASTQYLFPASLYVELGIRFFYGYDPISRAGTLVHEARHADFRPHTAFDEACPRGSSCDSYYGDGGANSYQIDFLWSYSLDASQPYATRVQAANRANLIAQTAFACVECSPVIPEP